MMVEAFHQVGASGNDDAGADFEGCVKYLPIWSIINVEIIAVDRIGLEGRKPISAFQQPTVQIGDVIRFQGGFDEIDPVFLEVQQIAVPQIRVRLIPVRGTKPSAGSVIPDPAEVINEFRRARWDS